MNRPVAQFLKTGLRSWQLSDIIVEASICVGDCDHFFGRVQNIEKISNLIVAPAGVIDCYGDEVFKNDETHGTTAAGVGANGD